MINLIHGDCLDVMRGMPSGSVDLVFTSPPYNLGNSTGAGVKGNAASNSTLWTSSKLGAGYDDYGDDLPWHEYVAWQKDVLAECWRLLSDEGAIFYNHRPRVQDGMLRTAFDLNPGLPVRQVIIWDRKGWGINFTTMNYLPTVEWVVVFAKLAFRLKDQGASAVSDIWRITPDQKNPHPAPFPLGLPLRAIVSTTARHVLDPFMGSGTTGRAAVMEGRDFTGIDRVAAYVEMARQNIATSEQQPMLFTA